MKGKSSIRPIRPRWENGARSRSWERGSRHPGAGKESGGHILHPFDLLVPVIVGDEQLGYVQVHLLLDNIRAIQHANFLRRLAVTCIVFMIGIFLTIFLARRYTKPIHRLVDGVKESLCGGSTSDLSGRSGGRDR